MKEIITNNVVQKPIDFHSWKMIAASKGYCKTINQTENRHPLDVVTEYLTTEAVLVNELSDRDLYYWLIKAITDVLTINQINNFIQYDLRELFDKNTFERKEINYRSVCEMLVQKLHSLQVRKSVDDELVDLYVIFDEDGKGMSIDEANDKWLNEEKKLTK